MNSKDNMPVSTEDILDQERGLTRKLHGIEKFLVPTIAFCWSLFQLSIASWLILDAFFIRAIHLAFALAIVFLSTPFFKKKRFGIKFLSEKNKIPHIDYFLAGLACFCALYVVIDYIGITTRYGLPISRDIIVGIALIVLLFDATRRAIGPTLPIIATLFCLYAFFGAYMPDILAFKGVSLSRFIGQITMSTEGI
ncbi:MAG TPA: hypothetical protein VMW66_04890, partial [Elusimicrobiales bacterium]|nr:hypothetical protein [Elusimicrobiales bacterium]